MATVYLARLGGAGGFQRFVAIKRLHPHLAKDNEFTQMFLDEARLAARLHHPNVVPILEIGESPEGYYLVMEYIEGDTLARILARSAQAGRALPAKVAIRSCLDALHGLHTAHELTDDDGKPLHIVHRDVSPQNILVGVDGTSRIADFGVARATSRLSTTRTGQLKGKLAYMAPEQARGKEVDRRADVFAMGIVTWESLGQKRLFKGEGEADTLNRVLYEPIPKLRAANPTVPAELEAVVMKALEREPDARFATAADFAEALEKAARNVGALGAPRDVKEHLDAVLGTDISQQRDAVRAWLARSEPSQRMTASLIGQPSSVTKVEGARQADASGQHNAASSVSSAVIQLPGSASSSASSVHPLPVVETLPSKRRSKAWAGVVVIALVLGIGGIAFFRFRGPSSPTTATTSQATGEAPTATSVGAATTTTQTTIAASATSTPSAPVASSASTQTSAATTKPTGVGHFVPPVRTGTAAAGTGTTKPTATATTQPTATAQPTATSTGTGIDDLSHNPYR